MTADAFNPTRLLHSRTEGPVSAYGASFLVVELPQRWRAVACEFVPTTEQDQGRKTTPAEWSKELSALLDQQDRPLLKSSPSGEVSEARLGFARASEVPVICKRGHPASFIQRMGASFRGPKQWREFWTGHLLRQQDLPTPLPLACMWRPTLWHVEAFLVTQYLPAALPLDRALRRLHARDNVSSSEALDQLTAGIAEMLVRLAKAQHYHRDLKVSNVLVTGLPTSPIPWLIDLDGVRREFQSFGPNFTRMLARLSASIQESAPLPRSRHLRALKRMLSYPDAPEKNWKSMWHEVASGVGRAHRRHRRKRALVYDE